MGGAERRDGIPSRLHSAGPDAGLELTDCEIVTWAEIKNQTLNQLCHPGTPRVFCFCFFNLSLIVVFSSN